MDGRDGLAVLAFLLRERVFIKSPAEGQGALAHGDVVLLAAGEIVQGKRKLATGHSAQITLEPVRHMHACLGASFGNHVHHDRQSDKGLDHGFWVLRCYEEIQIMHGFFASTITPTDLRARHIRMALQSF